MEILTAYGPHLKVNITFSGKGRTKQSFKAECDINNILARFKRTGVIEFTSKYQAQYGDVTALDFTEAMHTIATAKSMFHDMPSHLRARFKNDPAEFLAFVDNPANKEEARALGLLKPEEPAAAPVQGATAAPATGGEGATPPPSSAA